MGGEERANRGSAGENSKTEVRRGVGDHGEGKNLGQEGVSSKGDLETPLAAMEESGALWGKKKKTGEKKNDFMLNWGRGETCPQRAAPWEAAVLLIAPYLPGQSASLRIQKPRQHDGVKEGEFL